MRLMDKIRSDSRERETRDREALQRETQLQERDLEERHREERERSRMSTAEIAEPASARAMADGQAQMHPAAKREPVRRVEEPAGKLRDTDVEDAVEIARREPRTRQPQTDEPLAPLFRADVAQGFRSRWDAAQIGFVDDPRRAVQQADELVAEVMKSLAQSFADERRQLEAQMKETASTENLRMALQRYRSFFQRLLSL